MCTTYLDRASSASHTPATKPTTERYYKTPYIGAPGTYCGVYTVNRNSGYQTYLSTLFLFDIWNYCNYGHGANVTLTIDSWQSAIWPGGYLVEGALRPVTWHCHCP